MTVHVVYLLSPAGQRAAAVAGSHPRRVQVLKLPVSAALVERAHVIEAGVIVLGIGGSVRLDHGSHDQTETAHITSWMLHDSIKLVADERRRVDPFTLMPAPQFDAPLATEDDVVAAFDADRLALEAEGQRRLREARETL